ncbi:hypothetical protein [Natrinema gelatinilyticum]|uniref:hypothetical protein n=1 Tax=Natrinema gelatinilyticum TaxID=2961571 RepID=UPI0020C35ECE|nr:hypothetical protein [Natrinema gelatinilyticum]
MGTNDIELRTRFEQSAGAIAAVGAVCVLTVAPLYLFTGSPESYYLGVPLWGWLSVAIYYVMLVLVVFTVRTTGIVGASAEATTE